MEIKINGKTQELNFGVKFVRLLDKKMPIVMNVKGMGEQPFGMALTRVVPALKTFDTAVLSDVIYLALWVLNRVHHKKMSMPLSMMIRLTLKSCSLT